MDFLHLLTLTLTLTLPLKTTTAIQIPTEGGEGIGKWEVLHPNIGISAMHMQLLHNDHVIIFDRTDFGPSNLSLPSDRCRDDPNDHALTHDCTAHSVDYYPLLNSTRPLSILTDTWCSSASTTPSGMLVQTGGFNDGDRTIRAISPCPNCDWKEFPSALTVRRWYATNHILPDGRQIVVGGRRQFNYEFVPPKSKTEALFVLPLLRETKDPNENNLYPFLHLNVDGNLFVYSNNKAILLDYTRNVVVKTFPTMPGAHPRNYPSSGSSVMLPLKPDGEEAEILVCGGAPRGAYEDAQGGSFAPALDTCGRIRITDANPTWEMETMPVARVMGDMVLLPTGGEVIIINGAQAGTAGWEFASQPALSPVLYRFEKPFGERFEVQNPSSTPRLYHSSAILLRDGRVVVGGSNPHVGYSFYGMTYPTELSLEAFHPHYLSEAKSSYRPRVVSQSNKPLMQLHYGENFTLRFAVPIGKVLDGRGISTTMIRPAFSTHSFSMNQRALLLKTDVVEDVMKGYYNVLIMSPKSAVLAPPGYYMLFICNGDVPSEGVWVHIQDK